MTDDDNARPADIVGDPKGVYISSQVASQIRALLTFHLHPLALARTARKVCIVDYQKCSKGIYQLTEVGYRNVGMIIFLVFARLLCN
jgi:hypothetical protein